MESKKLARWTAAAGAVAVFAGVQAVVQLAGAAPASAASGLTVTSAITAFDSVATKTATAKCPAGKRVVGGGGRVNGPGGKASVTRLQPVHPITGVDSYVVTGTESDNGFAGTWSVQAYAICANPLAGLQIVSASNVPSSSEVQIKPVGCPTGKRVLGVGGRINGPAGQVSLQEMATDNPFATFTSVTGLEDADGFAGNWGLTAYAICANPVAGFKIASAASAHNSDGLKIVTATCPSGTRVHASMMSIGAGTGDVVLDAVVPNATLTSVSAIAREETGTTQKWAVSAQAICAN